MRKLHKGYKTEIAPTSKQKEKINQTIGVCRYMYNFYISHNKEIYEQGGKFVSGMDFQKWINNEYLPQNPDKLWIKDAYNKAVNRSIMNADRAFRYFFTGKKGFPKYKKKNVTDSKMYFVKNNDLDCICERHRIKIPTLGWVKIKEKGYIPTDKNISSGTVSCKAGRYYVSVVVEENRPPAVKLNDCGLGIDLGIKEFAVLSDGTVKKNINKTQELRKLEQKLKREQRSLSRKYEDYEKRKKKGETTRKNIDKQILKLQKIHQRIANIRKNYINNTVSEIVKTKPSYITIEDLNVKAMMKNKHLSKAIAAQKFYDFRVQLESKCKEMGIELRVVDRWYPSSKTCHKCGKIKGNLKLSERQFRCSCGYQADRDYNASLNLRDAKEYVIV